MPPKTSSEAAPIKVKSIAQKRKAQEEKLADTPTTPSKRPKNSDFVPGEGGAASSPAKPITPSKYVINLNDWVLKVSPESYVNPTARQFFHEVKVCILTIQV